MFTLETSTIAQNCSYWPEATRLDCQAWAATHVLFALLRDKLQGCDGVTRKSSSRGLVSRKKERLLVWHELTLNFGPLLSHPLIPEVQMKGIVIGTETRKEYPSVSLRSESQDDPHYCRNSAGGGAST